MSKVGRNDPCPCGSGKKYKQCCLGQERDTANIPMPPKPKEPKTSRRGAVAIAGLTFGQVDELSEEEKRKAHTAVEFQIPFELKGLPDSSYIVQTSCGAVAIDTHATPRSQGVLDQFIGYNTQGNIELDEDRWGRGSCTIVKVELPQYHTVDDEQRMLRRCVEAVNELISAYSLVSNRYHLDKVRVADILGYKYHLVVDGEERMHTHIDFREPLHMGGKRVHGEQRATKIQRILDEKGPELWQRFLIDAERAQEYEEYARTIIDSVVALEIVLYEYISTFNRMRGIPKGNTKKTLIRIGLTGNLDVELKQIAPPGTFQKDDLENVLSECKGIIKKRNSILHEGARDIHENDGNKSLEYIPHMINNILALTEDLKNDN